MASGKLKSVTPSDKDNARKFDTGACRSDSSKKLNFIKALSPLVLEAYVDYIRSFNVRNIKDKVRDEDNWKLGIPKQDYLESKARHFIETWKIHEGYISDKDHEKIIRCLCAEMFNTHGYLHTLLVERLERQKIKSKPKHLKLTKAEKRKIMTAETYEEVKKILNKAKKRRQK